MKRIVSSKKVSPATISNLRGSTVAAQNAITNLTDHKDLLTRYCNMPSANFDVLKDALHIITMVQSSIDDQTSRKD